LTNGSLTSGLINDVLVKATMNSAIVIGGPSDNTIDAHLFAGKTILVGGGGNDTLIGGKLNILIGGTGSDTLTGNAASDLLIAGYTDYDQNIAALAAIMQEWSRTDIGYNGRVNHILGTTAGGLNGSSLFNTSTIHDDGVADTLTGGNALDWFFANVVG